MSQYPPGFGQWPDPASYQHPYSQAPHQPPQQNQNPAQHHAPAYDYHAPTTPAAPGHYPTSQAAFNYNATQIPGLGISSGGTPAQYQSPWAPPQVYGGYAQQQPPAIPKPQPLPQPASTSNFTAASTTNHTHDAMEEGELTEEDFDDLYEPQPADNSHKPAAASSAKASARSGRDTQDGQDEAFYGAEPGEVMSNRGGSPARERSGSYSPYLSPREIDLDAGTSRDASDVEAGRARPASSRPPGSLTAKQPTNGYGTPNNIDAAPAQPTAIQSSTTSTTATIPPKSAEELKKEAQKSILRLLPLGVKFQNYIEEGFDESIVKSLFGDLNLLPATAPAKPPVQSTQAEKPTAPEPSNAGPAKAKDKTEERKDRIARLLAAKAAKTTTTTAAAATTSLTVATPVAQPRKPTAAPIGGPIPSAPAAMLKQPPPSAPTGPAALQNAPPPSAPTAPAAFQNLPPPAAPTGPAALRKEAAWASVSKPKSKTDKELLLKKKMEALLKARGAQAQQQSATSTPTVPKPSTIVTNPNLPQKPEAATAPRVAEISTAQTALPPRDFAASPAPLSAPADSSIPGLYLSTSNGSQHPPTLPSRKRPVAADFVDYPSSAGASKRQFRQHRQDSFVIDVSEDESDDDVEMEVDSPGAGSPSSSNQHIDTPGRKGPSIKDYPPLSDGPPKRPLSRTNSNGPRPAKLHQLKGEISSLQRKIAELEARKAKKIGSGAQTPEAVSGTPAEPRDSTTESTMTPKEHEAQGAAPLQRAVSTSDVDSTDLPSAQLISEAASAGLPKRLEPPRKKPVYGKLAAQPAPQPIRLPQRPEFPGNHLGLEADRRTRIASFHIPKVEATLMEKKTKLKLLEQKTAQLRLEIEKEAAEREKLAEELRQLEAKSTQNGTHSDALGPDGPAVAESPERIDPPPASNTQIDAENQAEPAPRVSQPPEPPLKDTDQPDEPNQSISPPDDNDTAGAESMVVDEAEQTPNLPSVPFAQPAESSPHSNGTNHAISAESDTAATAASGSAPATKADANPESPPPPIEDDEQMDSAASTPESGQIDESEAEPEADLETQPAAPDEPSAEAFLPDNDDSAEEGETAEGSPVPAMISDVALLDNEEAGEAQRTANGEVHVVAPARQLDSIANNIVKQNSSRPAVEQLPSFTPYESPLKCFRSYRFHPEYAQTVQGGLRSLTYTNKINPKQALCPNELTEKKCNDADCRFQHFTTMRPKDEQILIELGRADEFAEGEEKNRFIGGLKDVLMAFRAAKVKDYDKIGYGIIEYRRKFIGDRSRVLSGLRDTEI